MKKLIILTICIAFLGIYTVQAQEKSKKAEIPAAVKTAFQTKYPKAEKVEWGMESKTEFEAEFKLNGIESSAVFDQNGKFIESETEIKNSELPQTVKTTLTKDFAGYKIGEIAKSTDSKGIETYEIEASKGKEKFEISFDVTGKLLEKTAVKKEDEEKK